jgi:ankyrin repeat protein
LSNIFIEKDISAADKLGATPLHKAAALGRVECLSILLSKRADVNKVGILLLFSVVCFYFHIIFLILFCVIN